MRKILISFVIFFLLHFFSCQTNSGSTALLGYVDSEISTASRVRATRFYQYGKRVFSKKVESSSDDFSHVPRRKIERMQRDLNSLLREIKTEAKRLEKKGIITAADGGNCIDDIEIQVTKENKISPRVKQGEIKIIVPVRSLFTLAKYVVELQGVPTFMPVRPQNGDLLGMIMGDVLNEMDKLRASISYEDALRFIVAHEFVHLWLDPRIKNPSIDMEIRADAIGFLLTTLTSKQYELKKKLYDTAIKTGSFGSDNTYILALWDANIGAGVLFQSLNVFLPVHLKEGSEYYPSLEARIDSVDSFFDQLVGVSTEEEIFIWAQEQQFK